MDKYRGLYVHIPFCVRKCLYCDFVSFPGMENVFDKYIDAVLEEAKKYEGMEFETVFLGGGTPSVLNCSQLDRLFDGLEKVFSFAENCEASIEANPKTLSDEKMRVLNNHIINRVSVGVQSFNDTELKAMGRIHTSKEALESIELISRYFDNFNIDIMTSVPFQTSDSLMNTLKTAIGTGAKHLSCYSLIIEPGTPFYDMYEKGEFSLPSDEEDREMYIKLAEFLGCNGYKRYEISNYAREGYECRHNIKYWTTNEYIGLGAAAHSYYNGVRFSNTPDLNSYIGGEFEQEREALTEEDKISEYIMMSMRMSSGLDEDEFYNRFGKNFYDINKNKIDLYTQKGFIKKTENGFAFTDKGFDVSNALLCELI